MYRWKLNSEDQESRTELCEKEEEAKTAGVSTSHVQATCGIASGSHYVLLVLCVRDERFTSSHLLLISPLYSSGPN
ncbi:hypothetical protein J6590_034492 [Homalodisca vitripennis]|nr:hypothetical protein J6590_034492 [Homalodisca vitripennis]